MKRYELLKKMTNPAGYTLSELVRISGMREQSVIDAMRAFREEGYVRHGELRPSLKRPMKTHVRIKMPELVNILDSFDTDEPRTLYQVVEKTGSTIDAVRRKTHALIDSGDVAQVGNNAASKLYVRVVKSPSERAKTARVVIPTLAENPWHKRGKKTLHLLGFLHTRAVSIIAQRVTNSGDVC